MWSMRSVFAGMRLLVAGLLVSCATESTSHSSEFASSEVVDFALPSLDGKTASVSEFRGKKVYVKFWASW